MVADDRALVSRGVVQLAAQRAEFTREQVELIRRTVAAGTTDDELAMFLHQARKSGLDPLAKQIYCIVRGSGEKRRAAIQTGIDGYRLIAERSGGYCGNDRPVYEDWDEPESRSATVTVWKLVHGERVPFTATAYWTEYYPRGQYADFWDRMPRLMLGKVAEALALRKAFPADLSGVYVEEELHQSAIEGEARPARQQARAQTMPEPAGVEDSRNGEDDAREVIADAPARPANAGAELTATQPQIKAIYAIGRGERSMDETAVDAFCVEQFGARPAELTRRQASALIDALKNNG
jgi:phage recombination protein Bet